MQDVGVEFVNSTSKSVPAQIITTELAANGNNTETSDLGKKKSTTSGKFISYF